MNYVKESSKGKGTLLFTTGTDLAPSQEWHTLTCCHCNCIFIVIPGSGKERGWCFMCSQSTCGAQACDPALGCVPFEKKLEVYERVNRFKMELGYVIGTPTGK